MDKLYNVWMDGHVQSKIPPFINIICMVLSEV